MIESRPTIKPDAQRSNRKDIEEFRELMESFSKRSPGIIKRWQTYIEEKNNKGNKIVASPYTFTH